MSSSRVSRTYISMVIAVAVAMLCAAVALPQVVSAAGPAYSGPPTEATGPAYFGPAPNPFPYCENPTYFDPFPENVSPIGQLDVTGSPNATVTTEGITMTFELTTEGDTNSQYPGFFPANGDGDAGDQPKGVEMASGDAATISLSEPLFYTQWVFTDVDQDNEGFLVTPLWTDAPGQVAVFGGDEFFDFAGTTTTLATFNDTNQQGSPSESIAGRVQVDLFGASTGLLIERVVGGGQSGFAVGGGCEPIGVAKEVTSGPTWNGSSFDVTYTIRVRNNLPSAATIEADIAEAERLALEASRVSFSTGTPVGIDMTDVTLEDLLTDPAFSSVTVVSNTNTSGNVTVNDAYNGDSDIQLLAAGEVIGPESEEEFVVEVQYVPAADGALGPNCAATYQLLNQAIAGGTADGVDVVDESDNGADPDPGADNGGGENDDPTPVVFECPALPAASLDIVKTVLPGAGAACPDFAAGVAGDGAVLDVTIGDSVTYCISVQNTGQVDLSGVMISDAQAPAGFGDVGDLAVGAEATQFFDVVVAADTPPLNTATASGLDPAGTAVPEPTDTSVINAQAPAVQPAILISKTVLAGADQDCAGAVEGVDEFILGEPGDPITWCFVVTNAGDVALTNVLFTDVPAGLVDLDLLGQAGLTTLAVDAALDLSLSATIPAQGVDNAASVTGEAANDDGTPIDGIGPVDDTNRAAVAAAALSFSKTVVAGQDSACDGATELVTINAGSPVTYCFEITNTGGVTLLVTEVVDTTLGITIPLPAAQQNIAPQTSVTVTHVAAATDVVNTAGVVATPIDPNGDPYPNPPVLEPRDPAEVDALEANLSIAKDNGAFEATSPGAVIDYVLEITNAGPDAAADVVVVDTLPDGLLLVSVVDDADWSCDQVGAVMTCTKATPLAAGETARIDYRVAVDAATSNGDVLVNAASVTSSTPDPDPTDNETTETITINVPTPTPPPDEPLGIVTITNAPPSPRAPQPLPAPPAPPAPPLAVTGNVHSAWLILAAAAMSATGGSLWVASRRAESA